MTTRQPCSSCGIRTAAKAGECAGCSQGGRVELPPGRWVPNGRGIVVWRASATGLPDARVPKFCGTERGYQWHRYNQPDNWPLPKADPCGCRAAHAAHESFRSEMRRRQSEERAA